MAVLSINVLCYGDHRWLAERCLQSIRQSLLSTKREEVSKSILDIRIGLNAVSPTTERFIYEWASSVIDELDLPIHFYVPERNVGKYPLMRRMFHDPEHPLPGWVMWFDDDSFIRPAAYSCFFPNTLGWCRAASADVVMLGETWYRRFEGNQRAFFATRPWWTGEPILRRHPKFSGRVPFIQGAFWVLNSRVVRDFDWPMKELHHCGGDMALGLLLDQQRLQTAPSSQDAVAVNADIEGVRSAAERRGIHQQLVGYSYRGLPLDVSHQEFACEVRALQSAARSYEAVSSFPAKKLIRLSGLS